MLAAADNRGQLRRPLAASPRASRSGPCARARHTRLADSNRRPVTPQARPITSSSLRKRGRPMRATSRSVAALPTATGTAAISSMARPRAEHRVLSRCFGRAVRARTARSGGSGAVRPGRDGSGQQPHLWAVDPNGERARYGNRRTYRGRRMSRDFTGGYGPEAFSLRSAKPGRHRVVARFFGHRQPIVARATTLQPTLQTRVGTPKAIERSVFAAPAETRRRSNGRRVRRRCANVRRRGGRHRASHAPVSGAGAACYDPHAAPVTSRRDHASDRGPTRRRASIAAPSPRPASARLPGSGSAPGSRSDGATVKTSIRP